MNPGPIVVLGGNAYTLDGRILMVCAVRADNTLDAYYPLDAGWAEVSEFAEDPCQAEQARRMLDAAGPDAPCVHEWNQTEGEADENGTRIYCLICGADGDA